MSDSNAVYEISKIINNKSIVQNDLKEISETVKDMLYKKYVYKVQKELLKQRKEIQNNPTREINLIKSLKPFLPEKKYSDFDKILEVVTNMNILKNIENDVIESQKQNYIVQTANIKNDESIKSDGIYDIDKNCTVSKESDDFQNENNIYPMLFLIMLFLLQNK